MGCDDGRLSHRALTDIQKLMYVEDNIDNRLFSTLIRADSHLGEAISLAIGVLERVQQWSASSQPRRAPRYTSFN